MIILKITAVILGLISLYIILDKIITLYNKWQRDRNPIKVGFRIVLSEWIEKQKEIPKFDLHTISEPSVPQFQISAPPSKSDEELHEEFKNGNTGAFDKIYNRYKDQIFKYVKSKTNVTDEDAWSIVHDAFMGYYVTNETTYSVGSILYNAATQKLIIHYRRSTALKRTAELVEFDDNVVGSLDSEIDITIVDYDEIMKIINKIGLSSSEIKTFKMHTDGYKKKEIAEKLGKSERMIRNYYSEAIMKISNHPAMNEIKEMVWV
ncbi:MAG: sigma-70 family RNA polymerase sigma factor [Candidatus Marinimicrobia bacterium]|nr:sigma-70 family RNA polymerase sigma factor [Candidatus Neomarinimicrobiota bacterium]